MALISILSVFSFTQYNRSQAKSLTREAQTQLGHILHMEKTYFMEHNTYTFVLDGNIVPKGYKLYNVGFGGHAIDKKKHPCNFSPEQVNNYYELCGKTENEKIKGCWFKNKWGKLPPEGRYYTGLRSTHYYMPNGHCDGHDENHNPTIAEPYMCTPDKHVADINRKLKPEYYPYNEDKHYTRFIAYATGDILDPKNFGSNGDDLDAWRINGAGFLEHCNDPFNDDHDSKFLCGRNNAMKIAGETNDPIKNKADNTKIYCHGVTPI